MEKIRPMLFTTLKKYSGAQLMSDVVAGIIVAIIALPLSIALALRSWILRQKDGIRSHPAV